MEADTIAANGAVPDEIAAALAACTNLNERQPAIGDILELFHRSTSVIRAAAERANRLEMDTRNALDQARRAVASYRARAEAAEAELAAMEARALEAEARADETARQLGSVHEALSQGLVGNEREQAKAA